MKPRIKCHDFIDDFLLAKSFLFDLGNFDLVSLYCTTFFCIIFMSVLTILRLD